jgi:hypothetical protein
MPTFARMIGGTETESTKLRKRSACDARAALKTLLSSRLGQQLPEALDIFCVLQSINEKLK